MTTTAEDPRLGEQAGDPQSIHLTVNGQDREINSFAGDEVLATYLRDGCGAVDVKLPCGEGACGACTVLLDGRAVLSCLVLLGRVDGAEVCTAANLAGEPLGRKLVDAFVERSALQCGFCTPGWLCAAYGLLTSEEPPADGRRRWITEGLGGHLCRCTGYRPIIDAVEDVAARLAADPSLIGGDDGAAR